MSRLRLAAIAATLLPIMLGGCSSFRDTPQPMAANNDIPEASSLSPKKSQILYLAIINGLRDEGQARAALAYLDEYDKIYPGAPYAALLRAECLMDIGRTVQAEPVFTLLLGSQYTAAAYAGLGSIAAARNDWGSAVGNFKEAVQKEPSKAQYANDLGFAQVREGDYSGGVDMLGRASQLSPGNRFIRNNLILGLHLAGQDGEANRLIDQIEAAGERQDAMKLLQISSQTLSAQTSLKRERETLAPLAKSANADDNKPNAGKEGKS